MVAKTLKHYFWCDTTCMGHFAVVDLVLIVSHHVIELLPEPYPLLFSEGTARSGLLEAPVVLRHTQVPRNAAT